MKYLVNTDISVIKLFHLLWNASGNTDRIFFSITEYLCKLYLDVNDAWRGWTRLALVDPKKCLNPERTDVMMGVLSNQKCQTIKRSKLGPCAYSTTITNAILQPFSGNPQHALYLYFIVTLIAAITFILQLLAARCLPNLGQQNIKRTWEHFPISCL